MFEIDIILFDVLTHFYFFSVSIEHPEDNFFSSGILEIHHSEYDPFLATDG